MSPTEMESIDSRTGTQTSDFPEVDMRAWQPSDLPEVVQHNYPEAYGYIRPRNEPGEKAPKILAYDQAGMEVQHDLVSPLTPEGGAREAKFLPLEPPADEVSSQKSKHPLRGCTPFRLVILAVIVILAGVGGGVGGGIVASRSQVSSTPEAVQSSSVIPSPTSSTTSSTTSTSATVSESPTSLSNQTREFSFQAYEKPNYQGEKTEIYKTVGSHAFDYNCSSYIWQPNDANCCVTFCINRKWVGWWCQPIQQLNASGSFNNIIIGCGNETLSNSKQRC